MFKGNEGELVLCGKIVLIFQCPWKNKTCNPLLKFTLLQGDHMSLMIDNRRCTWLFCVV